jgi:hypothetical protein
MMKSRWLIPGLAVAVASAWLGAGAAEAGQISPTDPATLKLIASPVTLSLYQLDSTLPSTLTLSSPSRCTTSGTTLYKDVTDCWLPEWDSTTSLGKSVYVVVNGPAEGTPSLVAPTGATFPLTGANPFVTSLSTSAYPGQCTNFGSGTEPDFVLGSPINLPTAGGTVVGYELIPTDCGGMAVIQVGGATFIVPQDGTSTTAANGIPQIWENLYGGSLDPSGDADPGPAAGSAVGDGIATADEYRGFIVSTKQIRSNPLLKDVFIHLVTGQCPTATSPLPGLLVTPVGGYPTPTAPSVSTATLSLPGTDLGIVGTFTASAAVFTSANTLGEIVATTGGRARIIAVTSPTTVTALITAAFGSTNLAGGAWQLSESLFGTVFGLFSAERVRLLGYTPEALGGSPATTTEWVDNFMSYTAATGLQVSDSASDRVVNANRIYGTTPQKGIRAIECLNDGATSPYGFALGGTGSPNTIGNVVIFTKRVVNRINALIAAGAPRKVQYSPMVSYVSRDWSPKTVVGDGDPAATNVKNFIISKALQYYLGMEVGHSISLNTAASSNPHFPSGSGDVLDQGITVKVDSKTSGFNTFYIPTAYGSSDQSQLLLE